MFQLNSLIEEINSEFQYLDETSDDIQELLLQLGDRVPV